MNGSELFNYYTSKNNEYSQTLMTLFMHLGKELFPILEKAEKSGKRISIKETQDGPHENYSIDNIVLV